MKILLSHIVKNSSNINSHQASVLVEGYNSSDSSRIIVRKGMILVWQ